MYNHPKIGGREAQIHIFYTESIEDQITISLKTLRKLLIQDKYTYLYINCLELLPKKKKFIKGEEIENH